MLRIHGVILDMVADVTGYIDEIAKHDRDLARQISRARMSVLLNEAEGSGSRGGTRRQRYDDALGSAREAWAGLEGARAARYIACIRPDTRRRFDIIIGTFVRILHPR